MKVFQIVNDKCAWHTPYANVGETIKIYPPKCVFVEAPDYVFEGWGYRTHDGEGNIVMGDDRFVKPVAPEGFFYNDETGKICPMSEYPDALLKVQQTKQAENKLLLAKFLKDHPLLYVDGKLYGITMDDQTEISLNLTQYKLQVDAGVENPVLEWHAMHEKCQPWTPEALTQLALAISAAVYPWFQKMQFYKDAIYSATTREEVLAIELDYLTEAEAAALEAEEQENADTTETAE